jgi:ribosomal protein S18 acetylase RimI-like enzyme
VITRVAQWYWHALEDDRVVGRGEATHRPDGRIYLSIDSWHSAVFDQLAESMLADLPAPLYTVLDEADLDLASGWERAGFTIRRREWEYLIPTGLDSVLPPSGVTMVPVGAALQGPLTEAYNAIRAEVEATAGWESMPSVVLLRPDGAALLDPSRYVVAAESDRYVGLVRVASRRRHAWIGLIAVQADLRRRGIARALLVHVLDSLHRRGIETASAEVDESNAAAVALLESIGAQRVSSTLELVFR